MTYSTLFGDEFYTEREKNTNCDIFVNNQILFNFTF